MKKELLRFAVIACMPLVVSMMSACSDDENENASPSVGSLAGSFSVTNISYFEDNAESPLKVLEGDTLKIMFAAEGENKGKKLTVSCQSLKKLNDSLFVAEELNTGDNTLKLQATTDSASCTSDFIVDVPDAYVIMPYRISMSSDLDELVQPEVSYTDANGKTHTFMVPAVDIVRPDSALYERYMDSEGESHIILVGRDKVEAGWTKVEERKMARDTHYDFKVRYYKVGITSSVTVRYIPRANTPLTRDRYYLSHLLDRGSAKVVVPGVIFNDNYSSWNLSVTIGGDGGIDKADVAAALAELAQNPDVLKLNIDPRNNTIREVK